MSEKRSDRLRSIIAATVTDAAENAAPVTITGSGIPVADRTDSGVKTPDSARPPLSSIDLDPAVSSNPRRSGALGLAAEAVKVDPPATQTSLGISPANPPVTQQDRTGDDQKNARNLHPTLRAPQRPVKIAQWEKANVTLEPRDLAILQRSDSQARAYGFRIRKGGNPSLFVRAGLRLLDELSDRDPETWIKLIAATAPGLE